MKLNEKILACRRRAGLSQEALAERLEVSRQAVSRWECGEATPEPAKILQLARTFGVTADWLLDDTMGEWVEERAAIQTLNTDRPNTAQPRNRLITWIVLITAILLLGLEFAASVIFLSFFGIRLFNLVSFGVIVLNGVILLSIFLILFARKKSRK